MKNVGRLDHYGLEFKCPECEYEGIFSINEIVDIGKPFCSICDNDVEMELHHDYILELK